MPLDPEIILGGRPAQIAPPPSPLDIVKTLSTVEDVRAQVEQRRLAADKARQDAADRAAMQQALTETGGDIQAALPKLSQINPTAAAALRQKWEEGNKEKAAAALSDFQLTQHQLDTSLKLLQGRTPDNWPVLRQAIVGISPKADSYLPQQYDEAALNAVEQMGLTADQKNKIKTDALQAFLKGDYHGAASRVLGSIDPKAPDAQAQWDQGIAGLKPYLPQSVLDQFGTAATPEAITRAQQLGISPEKREEHAIQRDTQTRIAAHEAVTEAQGAANVDLARQRLDLARQRLAQGTGNESDVKDIVQGIQDGTLPPTTQGLYRYAAPVKAGLARAGYDLTTASTDWTAAQQHFKTLNGAQQTRLRQAVDTATHSLDVIDTLAGQWHGGQYPILNRANLALAKGGAYGPDVATTARQLDAQIADVTSELANAYMGGNTPTDHALQLAAKNLSSDWSEKTLKDMTALARTNLRIRQNAIKNVGAVGASDTNPYVPAPAAATPPAPPAVNPFR